MNRKKDLHLIRCLILFSISHIACSWNGAREKDNFCPDAISPEKIGRMVTNDLLSRDGFMMYRTSHFTGIHYAEACAGFGAVRLAGLLKEMELLKKLSSRYATAFRDSLIQDADHVDANVYGILPLELFIQTRNEAFLKQGLDLAVRQWRSPTADGMTREARYWVDDIWMISSLQVQAFRATGDAMYLDRAARVMNAYLHKLQQPNGLFYHGANAPFYWGRGNGWAAAGLAELLAVLPQSHPNYNFILAGYQKMMNALRHYQAEDGMWRQLIDNAASWPESSSTAMFGYALCVGVKKGLLGKKEFQNVYQKAWVALTGYVNEKGQLRQVCSGTAKSDQIDYYLNRPRVTGDLHGQAPLLWFATSLLQE